MTPAQKVWLLGAEGFTGQYLLPVLQEKGYFVEKQSVNISDEQAVEAATLEIQPDYIINLAAISFVPEGEGADIYAVNTFGPENILKACLKLKNKPKRIILASSSQIYGSQTKDVIDETCAANPINHYGCSKWAMEQIAKNYEDILNILVTRPFNYTGVGQDDKFLIPKIIQHFASEKPVVSLGNIDIWRDISDVRWVANIYAELLTIKQEPGIQTYNICSGKLISIRETINELQRLTGHKLNIESNPDFIRTSDIKKQCGDNGKLYNIIDKVPPADMATLLSWMVTSNGQ